MLYLTFFCFCRVSYGEKEPDNSRPSLFVSLECYSNINPSRGLTVKVKPFKFLSSKQQRTNEAIIVTVLQPAKSHAKAVTKSRL